LAIAEEEADAGSISDSVILVTVKSRFAGRKFLTPLIKVSKLAPTPVSFREDVRREEMLEKRVKSSVEAVEDCVVCWAGAEVIIVMRVVARTLEVDIRFAFVEENLGDLLFDVCERGGVCTSCF
jgi:hypothetical protein